MAGPRTLHPTRKRDRHRTEPGKRFHRHIRPRRRLQATRPMANRPRPETFQDHPLPGIRRPPGPPQAHARFHGPGRSRRRITHRVGRRHPPQHRPPPRPHRPPRNRRRPPHPLQPRLHPPRSPQSRRKPLHPGTRIPNHCRRNRSEWSQGKSPRIRERGTTHTERDLCISSNTTTAKREIPISDEDTPFLASASRKIPLTSVEVDSEILG